MFQLCGKNVIYVGGFGGIGFAACKRLLLKKIKALTILDLKMNKKKLQELKACAPEICVQFKKINLSGSSKKIKKTFINAACDMGGIDALFNGSGIIMDSKVEASININLRGLIHTTLAAYDLMNKAKGGKGGRIAHISSIRGLTSAPQVSVYSASKHGVIGFHRSISDKFYYDLTGISHVAICPGYTTDTGIWTNYGEEEQYKKIATFKFAANLLKKIPNIGTQTADEHAVNMLDIMENGKNGSIWITDVNKKKEVKIPDYLPI